MEFVQTDLGRVPIYGSDTGNKKLVIAITGALSSIKDLEGLDPPGADFVRLFLPGFHSPMLSVTSIGTFIHTFDQVIAQRFRGREITAVGLSTGSLVALGLRAPEVRRVLAVEPFFSTAKLWPLIEMVRWELAQNNDQRLHTWIDAIFGYTLNGVTDRTYDAVLDRQDRPASALVGDVPLMPRRPVRGLPSLTDEADRARLPHVVTPGKHAIPTPAIRAELIRLGL